MPRGRRASRGVNEFWTEVSEQSGKHGGEGDAAAAGQRGYAAALMLLRRSLPVLVLAVPWAIFWPQSALGLAARV